MNKKVRTILFALTFAVAVMLFSFHFSMSTIITIVAFLAVTLITMLSLIFFSARRDPPHFTIRKPLWSIAVVLTLIVAVGSIYASIGQLVVLGWILGVFLPVLVLMLLKKVWAGWLLLVPIIFMTFLLMLVEGTSYFLMFIVDGPLVVACLLYIAAFRKAETPTTLNAPVPPASLS